jgi:beta-glucosidase
MLKNRRNALPADKNKTVYIPKRFTPAGRNFMGTETPEKIEYPVNIDIVKKYFAVTEEAVKADFALVFMESPHSGNGYNADDVKSGGTGYLPISLQYRPYTAVHAREKSLAGGDPMEKFTDRSYKGKSVTTANASDLNVFLETRAKMKDKPVIAVLNLANPMVFSEFEKLADAILVSFDVQDQALLDIISGAAEPSGLLPVQMPAGMKTVEDQSEDVPFDMECYSDSEGNIYDFAFGLNWKGVIRDERTEKYSHVKNQ